MRHADAVDGDGNDYVRMLSDKGRKQAAKMGEWLKMLKIGPIDILTSPLPRAVETATLVAESLGEAAAVRQDERLACGMTPDDASALVHECGGDGKALLLTGHAPDLGIFASYLVGGDGDGIEMRKGAVACFDAVRAGKGGSVLKWLVTPRLLNP